MPSNKAETTFGAGDGRWALRALVRIGLSRPLPSDAVQASDPFSRTAQRLIGGPYLLWNQ